MAHTAEDIIINIIKRKFSLHTILYFFTTVYHSSLINRQLDNSDMKGITLV